MAHTYRSERPIEKVKKKQEPWAPVPILIESFSEKTTKSSANHSPGLGMVRVGWSEDKKRLFQPEACLARKSIAKKISKVSIYQKVRFLQEHLAPHPLTPINLDDLSHLSVSKFWLLNFKDIFFFPGEGAEDSQGRGEKKRREKWEKKKRKWRE